MSVPLLIARQSSWFFTLAPVMYTPVLLPTSKASVLWPPLVTSPAELSMCTFLTWRFFAPLMEKAWTGVFLTLSPEMTELVKLWA